MCPLPWTFGRIVECGHIWALPSTSSTLKLQSWKVSAWDVFRSLKGRHTAEAIFELFRVIMTEFNIHKKVVRVISDNASNMRKEFSLSL